MADEASDSRLGSRFRSGLIAAIIALMVVAGYAMYERGQANRLAVQNQQIASTLHDTQSQIETLKASVDTLTQRAQAEAEAAKPSPPPRRVAVDHRRRPPVRREDPRWKRFQNRLDEQNAKIEATRQDLASAKTDLSGSIARNHDELVLLRRKGERNYYEFDLSKSKQFRSVGPVGIKLRKANTKHQFADLDLFVDDANLQKKHINLYEPVVFYAADSGLPVELVINNISKNHIRGYVSEPKYSRSQLAGVANSQSSPATAEASAPTQRQRLTLPKN